MQSYTFFYLCFYSNFIFPYLCHSLAPIINNRLLIKTNLDKMDKTIPPCQRMIISIFANLYENK